MFALRSAARISWVIIVVTVYIYTVLFILDRISYYAYLQHLLYFIIFLFCVLATIFMMNKDYR